ncbi:hypothetical protein [Parasphingorhabdus cellanae]|uniref:HEAT repeat domain-containing protein n=1 Tax=Parasphingorhabdus cellanae TaxID=2806553 RepID=A0ABX7T8H6_9SPHN|nr:hypothetical protein [Parasphingorhabdus cellanae]QTD56744.1 hypothetical protein J4G78_03970 [Parasphingorhabdus cellanae]
MALSAAALLTRLQVYDGRAVSMLGEIEAEYGGEAAYLDAVIALAAHDQADVSSGATWLIKAALERGEVLSAAQSEALWDEIPAIRYWQAQLHICQSAAYLSFSADGAATMDRWLTPLLHHDRPFLRAWSVDALCRIAVQHPEYGTAARDAARAAAKDSTASVRARVRQLGDVLADI